MYSVDVVVVVGIGVVVDVGGMAIAIQMCSSPLLCYKTDHDR